MSRHLSAAVRAYEIFALSTPGSRGFSSCLALQSRRQVAVQLMDDVKGLGQVDDRMYINPGRARNELIPNGSARMMPWKRGSERTKLLSHATPRYTRPVGDVSPGSNLTGRPASGNSQTPSDILDKLYDLPPSISLKRRTTAVDVDTIHGSVSSNDVMSILEENHGLRGQDVEVTWTDGLPADARLRRLGQYDCVVRIRAHGQESAPLGIQVERLDE